MKQYRIAVIPGDGIGREVVPEGVRVLEAVGAKHGIGVSSGTDALILWSTPCSGTGVGGSRRTRAGLLDVDGGGTDHVLVANNPARRCGADVPGRQRLPTAADA